MFLVLTSKEPRKLSYAEVCQKPPKEPSPVLVQPLRELRSNVVSPTKNEENGTPEKSIEKPHEKPEARASKDYAGFRGNTIPRGAAGKIREQRRQFGHRAIPQGVTRRNGKEQYVPPRSILVEKKKKLKKSFMILMTIGILNSDLIFLRNFFLKYIVTAIMVILSILFFGTMCLNIY